MTNDEIRKNLTDSEVLFLTLFGEARGEPVEGQIAVANVVLNRTRIRNMSIRDICLQPKQFSCWNESDPNRKLLEEMAKVFLFSNEPTIEHPQLWWIVEGIVSKKVIDNTKGRDHYLTKTLFVSTARPSWAKVPKSDPIVIGHHVFITV